MRDLGSENMIDKIDGILKRQGEILAELAIGTVDIIGQVFLLQTAGHIDGLNLTAAIDAQGSFPHGQNVQIGETAGTDGAQSRGDGIVKDAQETGNGTSLLQDLIENVGILDIPLGNGAGDIAEHGSHGGVLVIRIHGHTRCG